MDKRSTIKVTDDDCVIATYIFTISFLGDREVLTEGKLLLLACENKTLQGFGLHSRKKVSEARTAIWFVFFHYSVSTIKFQVARKHESRAQIPKTFNAELFVFSLVRYLKVHAQIQ